MDDSIKNSKVLRNKFNQGCEKNLNTKKKYKPLIKRD